MQAFKRVSVTVDGRGKLKLTIKKIEKDWNFLDALTSFGDYLINFRVV